MRDKNDLDALVAYIQVIGTAVTKGRVARVKSRAREATEVNPLSGDPAAIAAGKEIFGENCAICHGDNAEGDIGPGLTDNVFLYSEGDAADGDYFELIYNGTEEGMLEDGRNAFFHGRAE